MSDNILTSPGAGPLLSVPGQLPTNLFRYGETTLFSTFAFPFSTALANTQNDLFSVAIGGQGQGYTVGLSRAETNLKESGRIPTGQAYDVYGVATQIIGATTNADGTINLQSEPFDTESTIRDLQNIVNNGVLAWQFTQTFVDICPVMLSGAGGGVYGAVSQNAADVSAGAMNNGNGGIFAYKKHAVALPGSTTFRVSLFFGSHAAPISGILDADDAEMSVAVRVVLLGMYRSVIEIG